MFNFKSFFVVLILAVACLAGSETEFNLKYSFHKVPVKEFLKQNKMLSAVHGDTTVTVSNDTVHYRTLRTTIQTPGFVITRSTEANKGVDFDAFVGSGFGIAYTDLSLGTDSTEYANWAVQIGCLLTEYKDSSDKNQINLIPNIGILIVNNVIGVSVGYNLGKTSYDLWSGHRLQIGINANYQITSSK